MPSSPPSLSGSPSPGRETGVKVGRPVWGAFIVIEITKEPRRRAIYFPHNNGFNDTGTGRNSPTSSWWAVTGHTPVLSAVAFSGTATGTLFAVHKVPNFHS